MADLCKRYKTAYRARHGREIDVVRDGTLYRIGAMPHAKKATESEIWCMIRNLERGA